MAVFLYALLKTSRHSISIAHVVRADISHARNELMRDFLEGDEDYLLFLDDDNPPEDVYFIDKLIDAKKPVISALVPSRLPDKNGKFRLCIFDETNNEHGKHEYRQFFKVPR